jgi:hypothetical protein
MHHLVSTRYVVERFDAGVHLLEFIRVDIDTETERVRT